MEKLPQTIKREATDWTQGLRAVLGAMSNASGVIRPRRTGTKRFEGPILPSEIRRRIWSKRSGEIPTFTRKKRIRPRSAKIRR